MEFAKLLFSHNESGISSSVTTIILDNNKIGNVGFVEILDASAQNTLLRKISLKNCRVMYDETNVYESKLAVQSL